MSGLKIPEAKHVGVFFIVAIAIIGRPWIPPASQDTRYVLEVFLLREADRPDGSPAHHPAGCQGPVVHVVHSHVETCDWSLGRVILRMVGERMNVQNDLVNLCDKLRDLAVIEGPTDNLKPIRINHGAIAAAHLEVRRIC